MPYRFASVLVLALACTSLAAQEKASGDADALRAHVSKRYPSLRYVDAYRKAFPREAQGTHTFWSADANEKVPAALTEIELAQRLVQLEDQHTAIVGAKAGKTRTLGILLRTAADGNALVWRVFDQQATAQGVREGMPVRAIDGVPTRQWLERAAKLTMGGHRRGRYAEAALDVGLATPLVQRLAQLGETVALTLGKDDGSFVTVSLRYQPMNEVRARNMTAALNRRDLPARFDVDGLHVGTLRLGAFAPQYDDDFVAASDAAAKQSGADDDTAMLAGYCAVMRNYIAQAEAAAAQSDVLVVDLRGNLGGFDRLARLQADALVKKPSAATFDWFAGEHEGAAKLVEEKRDPSCGHLEADVPIVVYTDAGTRSAGEFMTAWFWSSGATVIGETTMGAGGGYEFGSAPDMALPNSGLSVRLSANFSLFDASGHLAEGNTSEAALIDQVTQQSFAPSRSRPFAIQSVGMRPDLALSTDLADLRDGGRAALSRALRTLSARGALQHKTNSEESKNGDGGRAKNGDGGS